MFNRLVLAAVLSCALWGCENKTPPNTEPAPGPSGDKAHVDTQREAFRAAGKAAADIEDKGGERTGAADDALKAGR